MKPIDADDPASRSADLVAENIARLKELFPEAFTEGKIDFDVLKQLLGGAVDEREEKYGLNWHGKRRARQLALTPSIGTLLPCPEESVDWDTTQNLMIEGDNLEVLKLLQKSYAGKVKLIYIDPPYNTGKDFVYPDDYRDNIGNYLRLTGQVDGEGGKVSSNTEVSGRFHTNWLNMMYPRLKVARSLLRHDGVIFVSIDDYEVDNLLKVCAEVFGEENHLATVCWERADSPRMDADYFSTKHDYLVSFARDLEAFHVVRAPYEGESIPDHFNRTDANGRRYYLKPLRSMGGQGETRAARPNLYYGITAPDGSTVFPRLEGGGDGAWRWSQGKLKREWSRIEWANAGGWVPYYRIYADESAGKPPETIWFSEDVGSTRTATAEIKALFDDVKVFDTAKPVALIRRIASLCTGEGDLILDFFAGSGTTAHAVLAENAATGRKRRFMLVQLPQLLDAEDADQRLAATYCDRLGRPRTIAELTKERLRRSAPKVSSTRDLLASDMGFRVFKLGSSNLRTWQPTSSDLGAAFERAIEHVENERSSLDLLFEVLVKLGLELTVPIEERTIAGKTVYNVAAGTLMACLATEITNDEVEPLALGIVGWHKELAPAGETTLVFRDSAFADDVAKTNLTAILHQHGLENVRSL